MAYSDTSMIIHLVKDLKTTSLDDTVSIRKNLEDSVFEVTFKDNGDPLIHRAHEMTRDNVCDYVYLLLKSLTMDEDGYQSIQFSLPAMPRVIISVSKLQDLYYRQHFIELIENSLSMLDKVEKLVIKKPSERKTAKSACSSYYCNRNESSWPDLPASPPAHRYFE